MDEQDYYHSSVGHCRIWGEVADKPDYVIVSENSDYGRLEAVRRKDLVKKEDTWEFQQAQKRADELRMITAKAQENFDKLVDKLVDKALLSLSSRIKFNVLFGKGGSGVAWAGMIVEELEKMVKEKAPEVAKGKEEVTF